jgi:hypothetical protein
MSITTSAIIYFITIIISSCSFALYNKTRKKVISYVFLVIAVSLPVIIAGVRYATGSDFFSYINGFEKIKLGYSVRWEGLEYGYVLLNAFLARLGFSSQSIMFATSLIILSFTIKALLKRKAVGLVAFGFLTFMLLFYQSSFNVVRLMIAVSIFLYNVSNIEKRNLLKYVVFTFIAAGFHISVLITFPLYWIFNYFKIEESVIRRILLYVGIALLILFFDSILAWILSFISLESVNYYVKYVSSVNKDINNSLSLAVKRFVLYLPLLVPGILFNKNCKEVDSSFSIYYSIFAIGVIIKSLASFQITYVDRIAEYFLIVAVMIIPVYMRVFSKKKNYLFYLGIPVYLFVFWIYTYFIIQNHGTVPYQWIL